MCREENFQMAKPHSGPNAKKPPTNKEVPLPQKRSAEIEAHTETLRDEVANAQGRTNHKPKHP
jgi:hypothetical protein